MITKTTAMIRQDQDWWRGMADLVIAGTDVTAARLEDVHLSIAEETFNILARIPVTRPVSEPVRQIHHGIAALSYRSVSLTARQLNRWLAATDQTETDATPSSLSDLGVRNEGKTGLRQFLVSFEANSGSI